MGEGATGILKLDDASAMKGGLTGMQIGDTIDFTNTLVTLVKRVGHTLTITEKSGTVLTFQVAGTFTNTKFVIQSDGHNGDDIVLSALSASSGMPADFASQGAVLAVLDPLHPTAHGPGSLADDAFLSVDTNAVASYRSAHGLVFELQHTHHHDALAISDFM